MQNTRLMSCLLLLLLGCAQSPDRTIHPADFDPATGNLIALRMRYEDHVEPVVCQRAWSVWIEWNDTGRVFRLYDRSHRSVTETTDFDVFLSCLEELPRGIQVERLDTCGAPLAYAMPEDAVERLDGVMKSGSRGWAFDELSEQDRRVLCTCECIRLEFDPGSLSARPGD